jgi:hypothetical protein
MVFTTEHQDALAMNHQRVFIIGNLGPLSMRNESERLKNTRSHLIKISIPKRKKPDKDIVGFTRPKLHFV